MSNRQTNILILLILCGYYFRIIIVWFIGAGRLLIAFCYLVSPYHIRSLYHYAMLCYSILFYSILFYSILYYHIWNTSSRNEVRTLEVLINREH